MSRHLISCLAIFASVSASYATAQPASWPVSPERVTVVLGEPEIVFDYSSMSCRIADGFDLPDVPARAVRTSDGNILLIHTGPPYNFAMRGPHFDALVHECAPMMATIDSPHAYTFANQEWILSTWRDDGTIHALIHNEYHDPFAPNCMPGVTTPENPCWYNVITYASSTDGGRTFARPPPPSHLVSAPPIPWDPTAFSAAMRAPLPYGSMSPTNIVRGSDGAYYSLFRFLPDPLGRIPNGTCLMRTENLEDPSSWRAWDGNAFTLTMGSPYDQAGSPAPTGTPPCSYVSHRTLGELFDSLNFNTFLGQYIVVGSAVRNVGGRVVCGTFFSLSSDLIHWSEPRLIMEGRLPFPPCNQPDGGSSGSVLYPSLIDHESPSINFEISGESAYIYYVVWNQGLDRDLWRVPVRFELAPPARRRGAKPGP
jgi:hypothetical protein